MNRILLYLLFVATFIFSGCIPNQDEQSQKDEITSRNNYLINLHTSLKNLMGNKSYPRLDTMIHPTNDGLYYVRYDSGTINQSPAYNDFIYATFTGSVLSNGSILETTDSTTAAKNGFLTISIFPGPIYVQADSLGIAGLIEGIHLMKLGSKFRFIIPSNLAFGSGYSSIMPSYSTLIYDVQLTKIVKDPVAYDQAFVTRWVDSLHLLQNDTGISRIYYKTGYSVGDTLKDNDYIMAIYKAKLLDNNRFVSDSTKYDTLLFTLGYHQVVKGIEALMYLLKDSSQATTIIPFEMGFKYGYRNIYGQEVIPHYHSVYFEFNKIIKLKN